MTRRAIPVLVIAAVAATAFAAGGGVSTSLALFTDQAARAATFSTAASFGGPVYYLHNNPTPPTGGTVQQANLPLDTTAPTATTLYNYDTNRDAFPGRLISKGGSGADETDLTKYQNWRTAPLLSPLTIGGTVNLRVWSAMKGFDNTKAGAVIAYLRSINPGTGAATLIATTSRYRADWMGTATTWIEDTLQFTASSFTIPVGHMLEVKLVVAAPAPGQDAGDDMWFAYDTTAYPASLSLP